MKIKTVRSTFEKVAALPRPAHILPLKPSRLLHSVMRLASSADLRDVGFSFEQVGMELAGNGPWLVLMNHSSFLDFEILSRILYPRPYQIVATSDGFVGKNWLMRALGCIPTRKFVRDITLIRDMQHAITANGSSVVLYPEASYSFDGTTTPLPRGLGRLLRMLGVPVVMITAYGSFTRDPLYNNLQKRKVSVSARVECLFTPDQLAGSSLEDIDAKLDAAFSLDYFAWQKDNGVLTPEPFRADGLNRILYKCPHCGAEGRTLGRGTGLSCEACGSSWEMLEDGSLLRAHVPGPGSTGRIPSRDFTHIPSWYTWEREQVRADIVCGTYSQNLHVRIGMMVDYKAIYMVGEGTLHHGPDGFVLDGCDGALHYSQSPLACYSVYSDYFWYELGDVICIGDRDTLYYCFPTERDVVAKTRLAAEELYRLRKG